MKRYQKNLLFVTLFAFIFSFSYVWAKPSFLEMGTKEREEYRNMVKEYNYVFGKFKTSKEEFLAAKQKYQQMKTERVENLVRERAKQFLQNMIEARIRHLEALKKRIELTKKIKDQEKETLLSQITEQINWLNSEKSKVEAAQTKEEITALSQEIKDYLKNNRLVMKKIIGEILAAKVSWVIEKAEEISQKVSQQIESLKTKGYNTQTLESNLSQYNSKIESAKTELSKAENAFSQITNAENVTQFQEGMKYLKNAHRYLQEAKQILAKIKAEINQAQSSGENQ